MTAFSNQSLRADSELMEKNLDKLTTALSECYEQIMLLYNLSTHMTLDQSCSTYLQLACDQLTQIVPVEGIAIFLEKTVEGNKRLVLSAGSGLLSIESSMADVLQMHLTAELTAGGEALGFVQLLEPLAKLLEKLVGHA